MPSDDEDIEKVKDLIILNDRLSPSQHRAIRQEYQKLLEDAEKERENDPISLTGINKIVEDAEYLYTRVCRPREALLDAKLLNIQGDIVKRRIDKIQAGVEFNTTQFVRKLTWMLHGTNSGTENEDVLHPADWLKLGKKTSDFINRTPKFFFLPRTFAEGPEVNRTMRRRVRDPEEKVALSQVKATDPSSKEVHIDPTAVEVRRVQTIFHQVYEKEGRPLCFFKFIIDPHSFRKTIENMFHFATLIKDGSARMFLGENDTPVIEPVCENLLENMARHDSHCLFPMTVKRWKILVTLFNITEAAIPQQEYSQENEEEITF